MKALLTGFILLGTSLLISAQNIGSDLRNSITLSGSVHKLARPEFDQGSAPDSLPMDHMLLLLKRSPEKQAELDQLIEQQQDPDSSEYHHWLTPEEFGLRFGASPADIAKVTDWLQSQGFRIDEIPVGQTVIEFSGDAGTIRNAFRTEIRGYLVSGRRHWANSQDPKVPVALGNLVSGVASMHNFEAHPQVHLFGQASLAQTAEGKPQTTLGGGTHALSPSDYAVIYNSKPLLNAGINGAGRTIAVIGRSNIHVQDVTDFRRVFGLPVNNPTVIVNGADPGDRGGNEEVEAVLDNEWAGALAPNAAVRFIVSGSTNSSDGIMLSVLYAVNHNLADIITESFGTCERITTQSTASYISSLAQQATLQGMSFLVSSGDSGAAGCDPANSASEMLGLSVNVLGSSQYTTTVGGTQFNEGGKTTYWASGNGAGMASATSHIPENVWNQSCAAATCGSSANLWAGGGGVSKFFAKPSWQAGVPGIPQDGFRDVPDVALTAASAHDPYLICLKGSCAGSSTSMYMVGGTSAAAPSFAGMLALIDQKAGGRQGNANPHLYKAAAKQTYSACNGSNTSALPGSSCMFNDITLGNNAVPGEAGYGASSAMYQAGVGYDQATGLGSVNVANLANEWVAPSSTPSAPPAVTYYGIIGKGSGLSLDVSGGAVTTGTPIVLWSWTKAQDEQWQLISLGNGYYEIQNRLSGMVLDGGAGTALTTITQAPWNNLDRQKWQLVPVDDQNYQIVNKLSGMDIATYYSGTTNGTAIVQYYWDGLPDNQWQLVAAQ
jgi:subtilase family serine protease